MRRNSTKDCLINTQSLGIYPNIEKLFNKKNTICIEGNIAAGKSTFINRLAAKAQIFTLREPLDKSRDLSKVNLLEKMYQDPVGWAFTFQNYALMTMLKNHMHHGETKILERSIGSTKNVFLRAHQRLETISPLQAKILEEWHDLLVTHLPIRIDLIIYLRVDPEIALKRLKKRNRPEERDVEIEYLRTLGELYDQWLYNSYGIRVVTLNANVSTKRMMKELNKKLKQLE